jgi:archaemetzincin
MRRLAHAGFVRSESLVPTLVVLAAVVVACGLATGETAGTGGSSGASAVAPSAPAPAPSAPAPPPRVLVLQPLGEELSAVDVDLVVTALREFYGFEVKRAPAAALPDRAYYPPRKRYRAERLLDDLAAHAQADAFRVLGLTGVDISTTAHGVQDWGIMGLATIDGRVSVMSMFRCRRGSRSAEHARQRLGKVAVHEVGHTLGLEHCPIRGCLMEDARGTNTTTDREYVLCPRCRALLERAGLALPPNPAPPWPEPA